MSEQQLNPENFLQNSVGSSGPSGPSALLSDVNDFVYGEIVHQSVVDAKKFGKKDEYEYDREGKKIQQLVVVLQTDRRNWDGVKPTNIPFVDPDDESKGRKPPSEDGGLRTVFIKQYTNIAAATSDAVYKATQNPKESLRNGGKFGVKVTRLEDTGKGNPLKHHGATYEPPTVSQGFFPEGGGEAPASQPAQSAPAPAQSAAPAQQDPWGAPAPTGQEQPPF